MVYVYHRVPNNLSGFILRPLNDWKQLKPELFAAKSAKYIGRKHVMQERIQPLDCLWNDVLFLQPIHPSKIDQALTSLGHPLIERSYYKVPLSMLDPSNTILWIWKGSGALDALPNRFKPCTKEVLNKYQELQQETLNYYREQYQEGKSPLLYWRVPHIFYKGCLDVRELETISI